MADVARPGDRFVNGARVTNRDRLLLRANMAAFIAAVPPRGRPASHPDAVAIALGRPKKGWARRYLRARGIPL